MKPPLSTLAAILMTASLARIATAAPPLLHARGDTIADPSGHTVTLHGVNLGGWLVEEMWMQPFVTKPPAGSVSPGVKDHVSLWNAIAQRLGSGGRDRVRAAFRSAWIDESDFDRMKAAGINCVRLPFLASLMDEPGGVKWLDSAIGWASARGMYVILDMHGAPGGQSDQGHTGQAGVDAFFKSEANVESAAAIWTRLARRYRDNPAVAGYDLLNEPTGTPNSDTLYVVMDRLYRAVRAVDPNHMVFIEDGYTRIDYMPYPEPCGWKNVVYSEHYYDFHAKTDDDQQKAIDAFIANIEAQRAKRHVPYYVGEFGFEPHGTIDTLTHAMQAFQDKDISSSMWTYKVTWPQGGRSLWSLYCNASPITPLDPFQDSESDLIRKCDQLKTSRFDAYPGMAVAFQNTAAKSAQVGQVGK
jgi:aryl-phospho-beta-D-glucosidase BglC (GH1 family)